METPQNQAQQPQKRGISLPVDHVSDTAFMVAAARATESERSDALFKDPFARALAGEKAAKIMEKVPEMKATVEWMMAVRTASLDDWLMRAIRNGVDTVINLAAGLDSRPYRLNIPHHVLWVEADFQEILAYKAEKLNRESLHCRLERVGIDLRRRAERQELLRDLNQHAKNSLVLTEGLLGYLPTSDVIELAEDLAAQDKISTWLLDIVTPAFFDWFRSHVGEITEGNIAFHFMPEEGAAFFLPHGWKITEFRSFDDESQRLNRLPPSYQMENPLFEKMAQESGLYMLAPSATREH